MSGDDIGQWVTLALMRQALIARRAVLTAEVAAIDARLNDIDATEKALRLPGDRVGS